MTHPLTGDGVEACLRELHHRLDASLEILAEIRSADARTAALVDSLAAMVSDGRTDLATVEPAPRPAAAPRRWTWAAAAAAVLLAVAAGAIWQYLEIPREAPRPAPAGPLTGRIEDSRTRRPVPGARIVHAGQSILSGTDGQFRFDRPQAGSSLLVRAPGYRPKEFLGSGSDLVLPLAPLEVRAVYLSGDVVARSNWEDLNAIVRTTGSNAVVLGIKDERGRLSLPVDHPVVQQIGAGEPAPGQTLRQAVARWRAAEIYTIALVAAFKDDLLAESLPQTALRSRVTRRPIRDPGGVSWTDPAMPLVQGYNLAVIRAAGAAGFDEVLLDFIRYPAEPLSQEGLDAAETRRRLEVVAGFLRRASAELVPFNAPLGASVFGLTCTSRDSGVIGQRLEEFAEAVDYLSPMLYPASFRRTGASAPEVDPYRLVQQQLEAAASRLGGRRERLRPWLQAFADPSTPQRPADARLIGSQVRAARDAGVNGWMLWNFAGRYEAVEEVAQASPIPARTESR
jgi:hypothetical protein